MSNFRNAIWSLFIPLFYVFDAFNLMLLNYDHYLLNSIGFSFGSLFKSIIFIIFFIPLVNKSTLIRITSLDTVTVFLLFSLFASLLMNILHWKYSPIAIPIFELKEYIKFFYWIIILAILLLSNLSSVEFRFLKYGFIAVVVINTLLIIIGLLLNVSIFRSYNANRFGFDGLFYLANEASGFYVIANAFLLIEKDRYRSFFYELLFWFVFLSSFFIGTKSILVVNFVFLTYIIFVSTNRYFRWLLIVSSFALVLTFTYNIGIFSFFEPIYKERGLLYAISSGRSDFYSSRFIMEISDWKVWNYFFGGRVYSQSLMENDLLDTLLAMGIIGSSAYGMLISKLIPQKITIPLIISLVCFLLMGIMVGHFLNSGVVAAYLAFFIYANNINQDE